MWLVSFSGFLLINSSSMFHPSLFVVCSWHCQYGRMVSVCAPRDSQYRVAVTKVIGHNIDAIVCDTSQTAQLAIDHLKTHKYPPQTFLPLDGVHGTASVDNVDR